MFADTLTCKSSVRLYNKANIVLEWQIIR